MIKLLRSKGHKPFKIRGSHYHFRVNGKIIQIPHHHTEMGKGLEYKVLKDAGLKE
ncbi:MAG: type II toxin-antitoxin system HicA family toxin [Oscillospiraceae bacterium]|jgi:predicted RNA binding protein YcfA (HicA-like mRNA interferase family)|nr:type II toxin-antitoxin system HicA family toxin [Oscillospiraceae bacterium]